MNDCKKNLINQCAENFIQDVDITKCPNTSCEYEVCKNAMNFYKNYPYYKGDEWEVIKFQDTLNAYYWSNDDEREKYKWEKSTGGYKGAHLLVKKPKKDHKKREPALTADILTSIQSPINIILKKCGSCDKCYTREKGAVIKKEILEDHNRFTGISDLKPYLKPYLKAFAYVYYWCGNMMPTICNYKGTDECIAKIILIKDGPEQKQVKNYKDFISGQIKDMRQLTMGIWSEWARDFWDEKEKSTSDWWLKFVNDNYFEDYLDDNNKIRSDIKLFYEYKDSDEKEWFLNNTKLIIKRSYRIKNTINGNWNDAKNAKHKECIQCIFKNVLSKSGFKDEELQDSLNSLFE